jgi:hypothetical protein
MLMRTDVAIAGAEGGAGQLAGIKHIHPIVGGEVRIRRDTQQSVFDGVIVNGHAPDFGQSRTRREQFDFPGPHFANENAAIRKNGHFHRLIHFHRGTAVHQGDLLPIRIRRLGALRMNVRQCR